MITWKHTMHEKSKVLFINRNKMRGKDKNQFHLFILREVLLYYSSDEVVN